jgi:DNA-binding MarR family transcriptional regulator
VADNLRELMQGIIRKLGLMNSECYCCEQEISVVQGYILHEICRLDEPSMQQVADSLCMDITTFSRQVKSLTEKGLVRKEALPEDRRVYVLSLTEAGREMEKQIDENVSAYIDQIFSQFTEFEKDTVIRSIKLLDRAISKPCCQRRE